MKRSLTLIKQVVDKIGAHLHPEKIILFGSNVDGSKSEVGDIDLLIISNSSKPKNEQAMSVEKLFKNRDFPLDILVYSADEVERFKKVKGSLINEILCDGKVVYERAA